MYGGRLKKILLIKKTKKTKKKTKKDVKNKIFISGKSCHTYYNYR